MKPQTGLVRLVDYDGFVNSYFLNTKLIKDNSVGLVLTVGHLVGDYGYTSEDGECLILPSEWQYFEPVVEEETKPISFTHKVISISEYEELVSIKDKYDRIVSTININKLI